MTRDGTVGRSDATERSLAFRWEVDPVRVMRPRFADSIRASSRFGLHQQAGHMNNADPWVIGLRRRRPSLVVAVALANKTARIAWAVMHRQEDYQRTAAAA